MSATKSTAPYAPPAPDEPSKPCSQCARPVRTNSGPEAEEIWCTEDCSEAWFDADPARREGRVSLSDLTIEQQAAMFRKIGLDLVVDGLPVGDPLPS